MTKQEVLQGALALNCSDKKYTITVEGDKIIIETKYRSTRVRESTFRCIAHIKDDKTAIAELNRVLKSGGMGIIQVPLDDKLDIRGVWAMGKLVDGTYTL